MTIKEMIDAFVQEKISATVLLTIAGEESHSASVLLDLLRWEVKESEAEQARLMELLVKIKRDTRCTIAQQYEEAIKQMVNGN